ncbi:MAG: anion transporter [Alphaproteobacteria bacterium]|nr:anion transporter [Alphaproteobacteria bacterium]
MADELTRLSAILIFAASYVVIALGRLPGLRLDRAGAALIGASLMVACGALDLGEAYRAIDLDTIVLLLGMMIVVANLRLSGFFALLAAAVSRRTRRPLSLLAATVFVSGFFSAFLVNDTICLVLTPLVLDLIRALKRNPVPYLLAVAMASNIGSAATITGNPQNIMIGSFSGIAYGSFFAALAPVALAGLVILLVALAIAFRGEVLGQPLAPAAPLPIRANPPLVRKAVAVTLLMVAAFFLLSPPAKVAIVAGALLLLTRRLKPERIYREIDWSLLLLFAGLFIIVAGAEKAVLSPAALAAAGHLRFDHVAVLSAVAAILSNLVSNVPAVLVLKPFIQHLADPRRAWLTLAMASTLAGNLTVLGSVANLIVVERARRARVEIGFSAYFRLGAPVTVLTILIGIWWLA